MSSHSRVKSLQSLFENVTSSPIWVSIWIVNECSVSSYTQIWWGWWERPACSWFNVPSVFQPSPWVTVRWLLWHLAKNKASAKAPAGPINGPVTACHSTRTFLFLFLFFYFSFLQHFHRLPSVKIQKAYWYTIFILKVPLFFHSLAEVRLLMWNYWNIYVTCSIILTMTTAQEHSMLYYW